MRETLLQILLAADLPASLMAAAVLFCLPLRRRKWFFLRAVGGILFAVL